MPSGGRAIAMNEISGLSDLVRKLRQLAAGAEEIKDAALKAGISVMSNAARKALPSINRPSQPGRRTNSKHREEARRKLTVALAAAKRPAVKAMRRAVRSKVKQIVNR